MLAGWLIFALYVRYEAEAAWQRAFTAVQSELDERTARFQDWLLRVDRTLSWFRVEDLAKADHIAITARMLHVERFITPATTLFLVSSAGHFVAGTLPLPDATGNLGTQPWFKTIQSGPARLGLQLTGCIQDPFGSDEGVLLYRPILEREGVAGYVGAFLPQSAIAAMAVDDDPGKTAVTLSLRSQLGDAFGCRQADPPRAAGPRPHFLRGWVSRLVQAIPAFARWSLVRDNRLVDASGLRLAGRAEVIDMLSNEDWAALAYRAGYVALSLSLIMGLLTSMLHRAGLGARARLLPPLADGETDAADWMWELDEAGNLVGLAGNAPEYLLPPSGRPLPELAGPIAGSDMRWERLSAAIYGRNAFEGFQVPFQIPGRPGLMTIFEFSGQPVVASGGFWGTASLVSEEGIPSASAKSPARTMLPAA